MLMFIDDQLFENGALFDVYRALRFTAKRFRYPVNISLD